MSAEKDKAEQKAMLFMLRGYIASMTDEQQHKIKQCADAIKKIVQENGDEGLVAVGLVTTELTVSQ